MMDLAVYTIDYEIDSLASAAGKGSAAPMQESGWAWACTPSSNGMAKRSRR